MKCLTVRQPWASMIVRGDKRIETRSWRTPYRGRLLIHAGTHPIPRLDDIELPEHPRGTIVGTVELYDCIPTDQAEPDETEDLLGDFRPGRWAWMLRWPYRFAQPIPYHPGRLGIYDVDLGLTTIMDVA